MWIKKDSADLDDEKKSRIFFGIVKWIFRILELAMGPPSAEAKIYGCTKCGISSEEVYKENGVIRCLACKGEAFKLEELKWIEP